MKNINIRKDQFGFAYQDEMNGRFRYFPDSVSDYESMMNFFTSQKYDPPRMTLVDDTGKAFVHYEVRKKPTYMEITANYATKKILINDRDLWPADRQLKYLSENTIRDLPEDLDKALDIVDFELRQMYEQEKTERTSDEAVKNYCKSHANQFHSLPAKIEFL